MIKYNFDRTPRWWKEMPKHDPEIAGWSIFRFMLMKECMELSLRYGDPFDQSMEEIALHIKTTRQYASYQLDALQREGWLFVKKGKHKGHKSTITLNWEKINNLYLKYEHLLRDMEKTHSVNRVNPLGKKAYHQSVNGVYPLPKKQSVNGTTQSVNPITQSVNPVNNNDNDKENDKENTGVSHQLTKSTPTEGTSTLQENISIKNLFLREIGHLPSARN